MIASLTATHAAWVLGVARIVLGIIFFAHGAQNMFGWYGGPGLASSMRTFTEHLHLPSTLAFLVIALTMVGAIATVHFRFGLFLNWFGTKEGHGVEYHLLTIPLALVIVVEGAGKVSLDHLLHGHVSGLEQSQKATQR